MNIVYLGSPEAAVVPLRRLVEAGHNVVLVVTQPDRRRGRGATLVPSPVKAAATALGLQVSDRLDAVLDAAADGAELGVVVAYGRLIRPHLLAALPFVNLHFSLLPRWRGAAPVERALLAGDPETGVCLMRLEEGLDTGGVYRRAVVPIRSGATAQDLLAELSEVGSTMLIDALAGGSIDGLGHPIPQSGDATWAAKIDPSELRIDWAGDATRVERVVRLGRAWTTFRGRRLKVLRAHVSTSPFRPGAPGRLDGLDVTCGDGALVLDVVQPEGRSPIAADAWLRGAHVADDEVLGA